MAQKLGRRLRREKQINRAEEDLNYTRESTRRQASEAESNAEDASPEAKDNARGDNDEVEDHTGQPSRRTIHNNPFHFSTPPQRAERARRNAPGMRKDTVCSRAGAD